MPQYHQIIRPCFCYWLNMCSYLETALQRSSNLVWEGACHRNLNEVCHQFPIFTWEHTQNLHPRHHLGCDPEWKQSRGGSFTLKLICVLLDTSLTDRLHRETQCNYVNTIYQYVTIERQTDVIMVHLGESVFQFTFAHSWIMLLRLKMGSFIYVYILWG